MSLYEHILYWFSIAVTSAGAGALIALVILTIIMFFRRNK